MERLPAGVEATAIIRKVESGGGFAAVLQKGDPERGALILLVRERGSLFAILERILAGDFEYRWNVVKSADSQGSAQMDELAASRGRLDPDSWLIELDTAEPERFIAETIASG